MTKYQMERLAKKAMKYPHQLTDDEVLYLASIIEWARKNAEAEAEVIKEVQ